MKVLSLDPGASNFAYTVSKQRIDPIASRHQYKLFASGHLFNTITNLKDPEVLESQARLFIQDFASLVEEYGIKHVALERYMAQGKMVGITNEVCNIMIGLIMQYCHDRGIPVHLVAAVTWKNAYNAYTSLKDAYSLCATSPHQLDSCLIGFFIGQRILQMQPFKEYADTLSRDRLLFRLEQVSTERLVNRRKKRVYYAE